MTNSRPFHYEEKLVLDVSYRKTLRRLIVFGAVVSVLCVASSFALASGRGLSLPPLFVAPFVLPYCGILYLRLRQNLRRNLRDPRNRLTLERIVSFDGAKLAWADTSGARSELPWESVVGRERIGTTTLVWVSALVALFVPDSAWEPQDLTAWQAQVAKLNEYKP